ncbi:MULTISPECIES: RNA polymerase sigma factor [Olivibacter]|uniref:RNA polymerase sigma factor n=2 Tax=Olivibacter TaxID=376469 RepID=A0ABV6HSN9_9SPHI|nr:MULTISPECIES: sigma-70 family RNA polymerase sigma factor [Olivibacter]MCL4638598.1 sigma-70 family RNA polymerase sigma factor [Olivibacter sp. UJ_SKK_5.1]MDM8174242.1 sigma-70 family RNA polymerase sigma factor [Olivibacter sp. 47]MDX3916712.1 sigma-70 family RNA polymerase sigma factor [Pseudosphingobacterium sp.]QEL04067.1 sigma-70 family RNA polymerase sigma factor [Olivibacter sp. LS-1]
MKQLYTIDDLLEGCRRGERKAQESLYRAIASKMFNLCLRYATSEMEAEDMLQNGFIKVFQCVAGFRGEGSFEGWIRKIFVNTAIEMIRKNKRIQNTISVDAVFDEEQQTFDMEGLEVRDLLALIQQLPDGYRIVFNMYALEGYSHKEIAEALSISEGASKSQLSRARAWLKSKLVMLERGGNYGSYAE